MTGHSCNAHHHNRSQTNSRGLRNRGQFRHAFALQLVGELNDQDSVFRNEADQGDESDFGINIERCREMISEESSERHLQEREKQRAENGEWNRPQQNDERIAETVELRRQH